MLSLLVGNHRLPLLHMDKSFIFINETKQRINKFTIGYIINPNFSMNKVFREQVEKCINTTFGPITQPHIIYTLAKKKTRVLELLMSYETRKKY